MSDLGDHDLLQAYARTHSQSAFTALVGRHLNLVYAAAHRQVRSPQLAEEVAQSVFLDLARQANRFPSSQPLAAWLFTVTRRTAIDVVRREFRRQARERTAAELAAMKTPPSSGTPLRDVLDEAMESLSEPERTALLLRFFESRSLREVGTSLGVSEDTAQKRVHRALDRLRTLLLQRGVAVSAAGFATDLSAHALEAAPAGLGAAISTATAATLTASAAGALAMTTLQKTALATTFALVLGAGLYEAQLFARQRDDLAALRLDTDSLAIDLRAANQLAATTNRQLSSAREALATRSASPATVDSDPAAEAEMRAWLARVAHLRQLAENPAKSIPEFALLKDADWLRAAQRVDRYRTYGTTLEYEEDDALRGLRGLSKIRFGLYLGTASSAYVKAHDGQLPNDIRELGPYIGDNNYFKAADVTDAMLARYALRYTGALADVPPAQRSAVIIEITSPDEEHDQRTINGPGGGNISTFKDLTGDTNAALQAYARAHDGAKPPTAPDLLPYFKPPLSSYRQGKFLQNPSLIPH